jgi:hypothetical protein
MSSVEGCCRKERFEAGPTVHAGIPGKEIPDAAKYRVECRSAGGIIEEYIGPLGSVQKRDWRVNAHDVGAEVR